MGLRLAEIMGPTIRPAPKQLKNVQQERHLQQAPGLGKPTPAPKKTSTANNLDPRRSGNLLRRTSHFLRGGHRHQARASRRWDRRTLLEVHPNMEGRDQSLQGKKCCFGDHPSGTTATVATKTQHRRMTPSKTKASIERTNGRALGESPEHGKSSGQWSPKIQKDNGLGFPQPIWNYGNGKR